MDKLKFRRNDYGPERTSRLNESRKRRSNLLGAGEAPSRKKSPAAAEAEAMKYNRHVPVEDMVPVRNKGSQFDFGNAWRHFLIEHCKVKDLTDMTVEYYAMFLVPFMTWSAQKKKVSDFGRMTLSIINQYVSKRNDEVSPVNSRHFIKCLRAFYRSIVKIDPEHPLPDLSRMLELPMVRIKNEKKEYTDGDIAAFLGANDKRTFTGFRNYTMMQLILSTGLRSVEVRLLTYGSIDERDMILHITRAKFSKERVVPIRDDILDLLKQYSKMRGGTQRSTDYVFVTLSYQPLTRDGIEHIGQTIDKKVQPLADGQRFGWHQLRRKYASEFYRTNQNIVALQLILGHEKIETTRGYVRMSSEDLRRINASSSGYRNPFLPASGKDEGKRPSSGEKEGGGKDGG